MPISSGKSRKAINFDLDDNLLKQNYPSKSYKNAWRDIKRYLVKNGFIHRQYSGYVSKGNIKMSKVGNIIGTMSRKWSWLSLSVIQFDVTIVGNEYSFLKRIEDEANMFKKES
ncbi:hypothetical protein [Thomasclavelia sp.]|uniref:hypothetical protein n=1 Tax=Thomasclavelia sp. TaxID=3025757 RepID=UPI0025E9F800|nr:hypothetical protein [Thomasclavelia sp.]